jgi:hypothetical protein
VLIEGFAIRGIEDEGFTISNQGLVIHLPAAAIGLVAAIRASPDGVHPEHLGAASFANHSIVRDASLR